MNTSYLYIFLFLINFIRGQESMYIEPWFTVQLDNGSSNSFLVSGAIYNNQDTQDIALNSNSNALFIVTDDKRVEVATPSGTYSIYIHSFFCPDGSPLNPYAVFEKTRVGQVSNKVGPMLLFRNFYRIKPFAELLKFRLVSDNILVLLTPKAPLCPEFALQKPACAFVPPFTA